MHARLEELISLRDRQPVDADAALHVAGCTQCAAELARLKALRSALAGLGSLDPPPQAWGQIAQRLAAAPVVAMPPPQRVWRAGRGVATVAVASLALLVVAATLLVPVATGPQLPAATGVTDAAGTVGTAGVAGALPLGELMARSQQLEATLQRMPQRPAVEVAANSATIDALQSRIQSLDEELASDAAGEANNEHARALWRSRVQLLDSLVGVRYAEAMHAGYPASHAIGDI